MAIELLPLLEETGSLPIPGGEYVPPSASTSQEVADAVAEYLDYLNPDLRTSSLAYMTWLETRQSNLILTGSDSPIRQAADAINSILPFLPPVVSATLLAAQQLLAQLNSDPTPASPTLRTQVDSIASAVTAGTASWWNTVPFDPTNPEWVLVGTDTFTDYIHFEEEGHVYIIDAIAPIVSRHEEIIDGEVVYFGLGWWSEMAGDYRSQRSYLDFEKNLCHNRGHLMRGALVNFPKGGDGQISAYKYTPA